MKPWWVVAAAALVAAVLGGRSISSSPPPPSGPPTRPDLPRPAGGDARAGVVAAALSQVGLGDSAVYWASAAPGQKVAASIDWCGGFALWALHQAGLATDWFWEFGTGFLLTKHHHLPQTKTPLPGDVAYFNHNQHEAIVSHVDLAGGTVNLVNGNGQHGLVSTSTANIKDVTAFFSIAPLLSAPVQA